MLSSSRGAQQKSTALSSAEAELVAFEKTAIEGLGIQSMLVDFGFHVNISISADATAALAIVKRQGAGRLRHIDVTLLWLQQ